jgi:MtN3 and saliva related transmembrane protein
MTGVELLGWLGFGLLITAWVPQTWDTIKAGRTDMNMIFILLYVTSSLLLTIYSVLTVDYVFITLNALLTIGSGINLFYKLKPRKAHG